MTAADWTARIIPALRWRSISRLSSSPHLTYIFFPQKAIIDHRTGWVSGSSWYISQALPIHINGARTEAPRVFHQSANPILLLKSPKTAWKTLVGSQCRETYEADFQTSLGDLIAVLAFDSRAMTALSRRTSRPDLEGAFSNICHNTKESVLFKR